jgi:hypothetical protein
MVIIRDDRWAGTTARLNDEMIVADQPPASLVARVRELRSAHSSGHPLRLEQREREVLCLLAGSLGRTAFYVPTSGQHDGDEEWPRAAAAILTAWPDPLLSS